jgi:hypothetical protein
MHAHIDQLLSLRDGAPVDAAVATHVRSCPSCTRAVADLAAIRHGLAALPALGGSADGWQAVQEKLRVREQARARRHRTERWAAAASFAVLACLVALQVVQRANEAPDSFANAPPASAGAVQPADEVRDLRAQSQALDQLLAALPSRPAVERAGTSLPIESLEAQVQWLDHQLSVGPEAVASPADAEQLWRERVEVMNSLVRLRYAEAQRVAM